MAFKPTFLLFLGALLAGSAWAGLTPEQQQARDTGLILYNQHRGISAAEPLRIAAEAGDVEAQYYLGETLRLNAMYMTAEAAKWYEAAANQGNLFAMLRLSNNRDLCNVLESCPLNAADWREKALQTAYRRANEGDAEAMRALYNAGEGLKWLEKAAETGDSYAQRLLAGRYRSGDGWFFIPGKREEAIRHLLKASAEGGFPLGMMHYIEFLSEEQDAAEIRKWIIRSAKAGYINAVYSYATHSAFLPERFGFPLDRIKGYGLFYLISQLQGGGNSAEYAQYKLKELEPLMSDEEIEQAIQFAKEWEANHPPLSYFVPVYGF